MGRKFEELGQGKELHRSPYGGISANETDWNEGNEIDSCCDDLQENAVHLTVALKLPTHYSSCFRTTSLDVRYEGYQVCSFHCGERDGWLPCRPGESGSNAAGIFL
jgi:hypothetical protein